MKVLITNVGRRDYFVNFLIQIKKKLRNLKIFLADNDLNAAGMNLKDVTYLKIPKVISGKKKYLKKIQSIVRDHKINLIIPCTNYDLEILSERKKYFEKKNCLLSISDNTLIKTLTNKEKMYYFCVKNKINTPKIYFSYSEAKSQKSIFVIKKKLGYGSKGLIITNKLKNIFFNRKNIVQEYIKGDEFHIDILNDFQGQFVSCCVKRKISIRDGETEKAEIIYKKQLSDYSKKISKIFKHVGNLDCDVIVNSNNKPFFIDFNPRFGGGYPFTHLSGLNYLELLIKKFPKVKKLKYPKSKKFAKGISIVQIN